VVGFTDAMGFGRGGEAGKEEDVEFGGSVGGEVGGGE